MEFLLINHPLDCPICDQGGECELQDLSLGYGRSVSRFQERKRVVPDEDIGPLVATEMTRCIQCTRCVRFTADIAGTYELGGMYRGENLQIGTYDGKPLTTELSGNVVDVCPVGALTNKVFQFRARPWELIARESIGYHDAMGSNLFLHVRRGEVLRTVPRDNEAVNECWLSDRDRYSHQGLYAEDRAVGAAADSGRYDWKEVSWAEGLAAAAEILRAHKGDDLGVLAHPATPERRRQPAGPAGRRPGQRQSGPSHFQPRFLRWRRGRTVRHAAGGNRAGRRHRPARHEYPPRTAVAAPAHPQRQPEPQDPRCMRSIRSTSILLSRSLASVSCRRRNSPMH